MENGDQVSKLGYLCPQDYRGGGVNNPPFIRLRKGNAGKLKSKKFRKGG